MSVALRPRPNRRHFADDIFKCIFLNENAWISLKISLKFVPKVRINNIPALVQMMAWRRPGDKPLSEPMMVSLLTHICVAWPQWVKITIRVYGWCQAISSKPKYQMRVFPVCFPDVSYFWPVVYINLICFAVLLWWAAFWHPKTRKPKWTCLWNCLLPPLIWIILIYTRFSTWFPNKELTLTQLGVIYT